MFRTNLLILAIVFPSLGWATCGQDLESTRSPIVLSPIRVDHQGEGTSREEFFKASGFGQNTQQLAALKKTHVGTNQNTIKSSKTNEHGDNSLVRASPISSTEGCMEEVVVYGERIVTAGFLFLFFSDLANSYFHPLEGDSGGGAPASNEVGDEVEEAPNDPDAPYADCSSSDADKWAHAVADYKKLPWGVRMGFVTTAGPLRVEYSNGDTELWWVSSGYSSNPFGGNKPMPNTCKSG